MKTLGIVSSISGSSQLVLIFSNIKVFIKLSRWIHTDRMREWPKNFLTFSWISTSGNKICFAKRLYRFRENYRKTKAETFLENAMHARARGTRSESETPLTKCGYIAERTRVIMFLIDSQNTSIIHHKIEKVNMFS